MRVGSGSRSRALAGAIRKQLGQSGPGGEVVIDTLGKKAMRTTINAAIYANENIAKIAGAPDGQLVGVYVTKELDVVASNGTSINTYRHHLRYAGVPPKGDDPPKKAPLRAGGKTNTGKLAGAIADRVREGGVAVVEAVGDGVAGALKSMLVVEEYLKKGGEAGNSDAPARVGRLVVVPNFADYEAKYPNGTVVAQKLVQLRYFLA